MTDKTVTVVVTASCENGGQQQNCIDCPHFCGLVRNEIRDTYVVKCGHPTMKR